MTQTLCLYGQSTKRFSIASTLVCALALLLISGQSAAQGGLAGLTQQQTTFLPVEEAYHLTVEQADTKSLKLSWLLEPKYYLYKHRFKAKLEDGQGEVGLELGYSPALPKEDEYFGDVEVYYEFADITAAAERSFGLAKLSVTYQGCADAGLCYPPNTEVFTVNGNTGEVTPGDPTEPLTAPSADATGDHTAGELGGKGTSVQPPEKAPEKAQTKTDITLISALLFAFLGGLILNTMPCVFPILSLKVLRFATGDPEEHHRHAWYYLAGVVISFVSIAAVLIALQQAGQMIGWGFQLQSPGFVIALAFLFTAMGLSLSGVVQFGNNLMNIGSDLAGKEGNQGSFFTGVLAVVVASPCTAPFMGSALGFALTQPIAVALLVFVALGLGMAAPMVLLSYSAKARNSLPKPGPWMETLKEVLAFPLYATAVWLLWVAGNQTGVDGMAAALGGLVLLALGLFLYREGAVRKLLALASLLAAVWLAGFAAKQTGAEGPRHPDWMEPWSAAKLEQLRAEGTPVFVDVTADWCITCLANEKAVLFRESTQQAFESRGVVYMVADWTNYDEDIGRFVKSHGRNGIPLYVMYPANQEPFLLPQLLTPSAITDALTQAVGG